jgi:tetratricopeptide (TPR) repeat protein
MKWHDLKIRAAGLSLLLFLFAAAACSQVESGTAAASFSYADNIAAGRLMQALFQVETAAAREGWSVTRHEQAADLWDQLGDENRAIPHWMASARQQPSEAGLRRLAGALLRLQRWVEADAILTDLLRLSPGDSWAAYQRGLLLAPADPEAALPLLQQASADVNFVAAARDLMTLVQGDGDDPKAALELGLWLAGRELWPVAERAFHEAVTLDGQFAEALAYRGLARDQQQKSGQADFARAIELAPGSAHVQFLYGLHLRLTGRDADSLAAFLAAARLDPTNPAYAAELGAAYERAGDLVQARQWLLRAVDLAAGDVRFQQLLDAFDGRG